MSEYVGGLVNMIDVLYKRIDENESNIEFYKTENEKLKRTIDLCIQYQQESGSEILKKILKDYIEDED